MRVEVDEAGNGGVARQIDRVRGGATLAVLDGRDAAAFDAWWRGQDSTRTPRFDLFPAPGCANSFGALDISNVQLSRGISSIGSGFQEIRRVVSEIGFNESEKAYLVYYDGPTG